MNSDPKHRVFELTDQQRRDLAQKVDAKKLQATRIGFVQGDAAEASQECLHVEIPTDTNGEVSCCGAKQVLIDEVREFTDADGNPIQIRCSSSAILEMTDAPVHVHAETLEYYIVLAGKGRMVLGTGEQERIEPVQEGSVILIQPGQPHGIASDDPRVPIKALLTFTPGLAPVTAPEYRDEEIVHARTSERLKKLDAANNSPAPDR